MALAGSVEEALQLIDKEEFHVLVSDIGMPERDGYELIRAIRARAIRLQAVALTAYARREDREAALDAGFDEHLAKPVDAARLVATIAQLVNDGSAAAPGG